jgi:hypothetical protein
MPEAHHLFTVTRFLLKLATWFSFFLIAVLALALGAIEAAALGFWRLPIPPNEVQGVPIAEVLTVATLAVAAGMICIALIAWMFTLTARIIDTASAGDPFVTVNADRLNHIASLLLVIQLIGLAFNTALDFFPDQIKDHVSLGFDVSASGILAALLIFVLAQIFRRGSDMRAELEGTV